MSPVAPSSPDRIASARSLLDQHGQGHLLAFVDELSDSQARDLLSEIEAIDFATLDTLIPTHVLAKPEVHVPDDIEPPVVFGMDQGSGGTRNALIAAGEELIAAGGVAAFTVAGGQGTRLGWNGPKGTYPATPVTGCSLFGVQAAQIIAAQRRFGVVIPWYIMTSVQNDAATRAFLLDNNCFGLERTNIMMFPQAMMPALDPDTGHVLLADKHAIAMSPDGHGGSLAALARSGAIEDMTNRGVRHVSYVQVDNPLVRVIDPLFIGLHASHDDSSAEITSKMVRKTDPGEKVGVFARVGERTCVVEYSDLPAELAQEREPDGTLRFKAGSIAVHLLSVAFIEQLTADNGSAGLPYHRADKAVAHIDPQTGERITPDGPNAVKLEKFIFDALPLARRSLVMETDRAEEFAPIKNRDGADSPQSSKRLQVERAARWLESAGVDIARDADGRCLSTLEVRPTTALSAGDLQGVSLPAAIGPDETFVK